MIPTAGPHVDIGGLHPRFVERCEALCARLPGLYAVSGNRPVGAPGDFDRDTQPRTSWYFWERWLAFKAGRIPAANLAAPMPGRLWGGVGPGRGSRHNDQDTREGRYGGAIDFGIRAGARLTWPQVHRVASEIGIAFPLADRRTYGANAEPWHGTSWVGNDPNEWVEPKPRRFRLNLGAFDRWAHLRYKARHLEALTTAQQRRLAIAEVQRLISTVDDGIWGPKSAARLAESRRGVELADRLGVE